VEETKIRRLNSIDMFSWSSSWTPQTAFHKLALPLRIKHKQHQIYWSKSLIAICSSSFFLINSIRSLFFLFSFFSFLTIGGWCWLILFFLFFFLSQNKNKFGNMALVSPFFLLIPYYWIDVIWRYIHGANAFFVTHTHTYSLLKC